MASATQPCLLDGEQDKFYKSQESLSMCSTSCYPTHMAKYAKTTVVTERDESIFMTVCCGTNGQPGYYLATRMTGYHRTTHSVTFGLVFMELGLVKYPTQNGGNILFDSSGGGEPWGSPVRPCATMDISNTVLGQVGSGIAGDPYILKQP